MADLNKRLLRTADGPAPQQKVAGKNELEFVEGSDGAQHIKVVGKSGKVQDIGDRLESIENQQQEILERLDGTFNTKVTGSNVELIDVWKDFRCSPGTNTALDVVDVSDYKYLFIHYTPNGLEDYDLRVTLQRLDRDASLVREDVEKRTSRSNGSTDRFTVNSIKMSVVVYNKTDSDHTFGEIALGGVVG